MSGFWHHFLPTLHLRKGESWMSHAMDLDTTKVHMLNIVSSVFAFYAATITSPDLNAVLITWKQYRCDQKILDFPNNQFYQGNILLETGKKTFVMACVTSSFFTISALTGKIRTHKSLRNREPKVEHPVQFVDTYPCGREESDGEHNFSSLRFRPTSIPHM